MMKIETLYTNLADALNNELKFVDQDLGQLEYYENRPPVIFPCALIDLPQLNYSDVGEGVQLCDGVIEIRLALNIYTSASNISSQAHRADALQYFEIERKVNSIISKLEIVGCSPLSRLSAQTEKRNDSIRVRVLRYSFEFTDIGN
ncbi:MAG: hypothetical protein K2Q03_03445 [Sphingobacteriaceae bacterium]|nr:hypothetical protein [Sphingobacteriaceae bacterium]